MNLMTNYELEYSLINARDNVPNYYPFLTTILQVLYSTGCRPHELLDINLWSRLDGTYFVLKALKANNIRTILVSDLPVDFIKYVDANYFPWLVSNYRQFTYQFFNIYMYPTAIVDSKKCALYLYRHAFIKRLSDAGLSVEQIRQITGHKSDAVVEGYINSMIYY